MGRGELATQGTCEGRSAAVPRDLRACLSPKGLRELISVEVARLDWQNPDLVDYLKRHPGYRPQVLLSVLVFAYVTQEFESEAIAMACERDCEYQTLCYGSAIPAPDLIKFRRANRPLIEAVMARVLHQAVDPVQARRVGEFGSADGEHFLIEARRRLDIARHLDTVD